MSRILVVDDEPAIGWSLKELLSDEGHEVAVAADIPRAVAAAGEAPPDAILLDVRLGDQDGIRSLPEIRAAAGAVPVVVMTAFGDLDTAVRAVHAGAFDYLVKPFDLERVSEVVARALADRDVQTSPPIEAPPPAELVGSSPPMQEVFKQVALVAASDLPVLVTGPTGSGKEVVARAIHAHSPRHAKALVTTNLAALAPGVVLHGGAISGPVFRPVGNRRGGSHILTTMSSSTGLPEACSAPSSRRMPARPPAAPETVVSRDISPAGGLVRSRRGRRWEIVGVAAALLFSGWFLHFMVRA
ncbi:MAG: sigma-54-dependent transcriptional regulator, partial [Planctomycetota bacterium]